MLMTVTITLKVSEEDRIWLVGRFLKKKIFYLRHLAILFSRQIIGNSVQKLNVIFSILYV